MMQSRVKTPRYCCMFLDSAGIVAACLLFASAVIGQPLCQQGSVGRHTRLLVFWLKCDVCGGDSWGPGGVRIAGVLGDANGFLAP